MAVGEWDQRLLCPDGACVGVIGPDGTCKVCGRAAANWGDERKRGLIEPPDGEDDAGRDAVDVEDERDDLEHDDGDDQRDAEDEDEDEDGERDGDDEAGDRGGRIRTSASSPGDWSSRRLCPDGSCIGVIGPDGRCKVCGRTAGDGPRDPVIATGDPGAAPAGGPDGPRNET